MNRSIALVAALTLAVAACGGDTSTPSTSAAASTTTAGATATTEGPGTPETTVPPTTVPDEVVDILVVFANGAIDVNVEGRPAESSRVAVSIGDQVRITVASDTDDEVHLHTYDLMADVSGAEPAVIEFTANIPGIFEFEMEGSGVPLLELEVA